MFSGLTSNHGSHVCIVMHPLSSMGPQSHHKCVQKYTVYILMTFLTHLFTNSDCYNVRVFRICMSVWMGFILHDNLQSSSGQNDSTPNSRCTNCANTHSEPVCVCVCVWEMCDFIFPSTVWSYGFPSHPLSKLFWLQGLNEHLQKTKNKMVSQTHGQLRMHFILHQTHFDFCT